MDPYCRLLPRSLQTVLPLADEQGARKLPSKPTLSMMLHLNRWLGCSACACRRGQSARKCSNLSRCSTCREWSSTTASTWASRRTRRGQTGRSWNCRMTTRQRCCRSSCAASSWMGNVQTATTPTHRERKTEPVSARSSRRSRLRGPSEPDCAVAFGCS